MGLLESLACRQLHSIESTCVLAEVIKEMRRHTISSILVKEKGQLVGIITERDLVRVVANGLYQKQQLTAGEIMTPQVISLPHYTLLDEALLLMEKHHIRHLVITDGASSPRGIVTHTDIVRKLEEDFFRAPRPVREYMTTALSFVEPAAEFGDTVKIMYQNKISCIVVVDERRPIGILTERDVVKWLQQGINLHTAIRKIMSVPVYHVKPTISIYDASKIMEGYQIRHLVIWDGHSEDIGLLTNTDVVRSIRDNYRGYLEREAMRTRKILDLIHEGVAEVNCDNGYRIEWINQTGATMFGYDNAYQAIGCNFIELMKGPEKQTIVEDFVKRVSRSNLQCDVYIHQKKIILLLSYHVIFDERVNRTMYRVLFRDITSVIENRQLIMHELQASEEKYRMLIQAMGEGMALLELVYDEQGKPIDYRILEVNPAFEHLVGISKAYVCGRTGTELLKTKNPLFLKEFADTVITGQPHKMEVYLDVLKKHFRISVFTPKSGMFATLFEDITGEKEKKEQIRYLAYHDALTGIYNRTYFEKEIKKLDTSANLPLAAVMIDLNRLKLVNDAFGHDKGDQLIKLAAGAIKEACRGREFAARLGGDEFAMILPNTPLKHAVERVKQIKAKMSQLHVNEINLSASFGVAVKENFDTNIYDVLRHSEAQMYSQKLFESHHTKNELVANILKIMEQKTAETRQHCENVLRLGLRLGEAVGFSEDEMEKFRLLALLHDIGEITISENILKKPNALSAEEWEIIKRHPESGYRIVSSIPEFAFIAEYILCHHERIDGQGYPRGLKGEEIPQISRALAVVDAYEVMTRDTAYRKAMHVEQAKKELCLHAGTQFDSEYVRTFLEEVL